MKKSIYVLKILKDESNKEITLNVICTFIIKGLSMLISVLIIPAYAKYFDNDTTYGAWITIASVFTWITLFDFGIGNGLRNLLVKSMRNKDHQLSKAYISSAYLSVGIIVLTAFVLGLAALLLINWNILLKVPTYIVSRKVMYEFVATVFVGVVINFFFLLISSICYAMQRTFLPSLFAMLTQLILLMFLCIPNTGSLQSRLITLSYVNVLAYNLPILAATIYLFNTKLKSVRPSLKAFSKSASKQIISLGGKFFIIQLFLIALSSSNEVYITRFFSADDVVEYQYYYKMFYIIIIFFSLISQPTWSAITKAYFDKRYQWIKKLWFSLSLIVVVCILSCIILALIYQFVADIWLGKGILKVDGFTVTIFAVMTAMTLVINMSNCFSNGLSKIKCQTICTVIGAVIKLPFTYIAVRYIGNWSAVILANALALIPLLVFQPIYIKRYVNKLPHSPRFATEDV